MNLVIFGATGGTGRELVAQALEQGHKVTAFARDPAKVRSSHPNLRVANGNVLDYGSVEQALQGQDAALSALGVRPRVGLIIALIVVCQLVARFLALSGPLNWAIRLGVPVATVLLFGTRTNTLSAGTSNILRAMKTLGVSRFVCESSLGIGDSKGRLGALYNFFLTPIFLRGLFADKESQEQIIRQSGLDWIIVRPAALANGPHRGNYRTGTSIGHWFFMARISRADVADFMLKQLSDTTYLRQTPGISY